MATEKFANAAANTLNGAITNVATSLIVHSATPFPTTPQFRVIIDSEILLVTGIAGATFTVSRGVENTTPASHADNAPITLIVTAGSIARNPRSMSVTGDIEYLDANGAPASLVAPADGIYDLQFTSKIPSYVPVGAATEITGVIKIWAGPTVPTGYLMCDGSAVSRATYSALFAIISTIYGAGDGATTFNLPDLRQRFPLGKAASGIGSVLGSAGGNLDHQHAIAAQSASPIINGLGATTCIGWNGPSGVFIWRQGHTGSTEAHYSASAIGGVAITDGYGIAAHSHGGGTGSATTPPPFQAVNYIIKT